MKTSRDWRKYLTDEEADEIDLLDHKIAKASDRMSRDILYWRALRNKIQNRATVRAGAAAKRRAKRKASSSATGESR